MSGADGRVAQGAGFLGYVGYMGYMPGQCCNRKVACNRNIGYKTARSWVVIDDAVTGFLSVTCLTCGVTDVPDVTAKSGSWSG